VEIIDRKDRIETRDDNGRLHSFDDNPAVIYNNGDKLWYKKGRFHRKGGPAIEWANGDKFWYSKSRHHRIDGPAIERKNGYKEWFYKGKVVKCSSLEEFLKIVF